jgi:hypothetical protein
MATPKTTTVTRPSLISNRISSDASARKKKTFLRKAYTAYKEINLRSVTTVQITLYKCNNVNTTLPDFN